MTLFYLIIIYILYTIKKLKSRKDNYGKHTNQISYLEEPEYQQVDLNTKFHKPKQELPLYSFVAGRLLYINIS